MGVGSDTEEQSEPDRTEELEEPTPHEEQTTHDEQTIDEDQTVHDYEDDTTVLEEHPDVAHAAHDAFETAANIDPMAGIEEADEGYEVYGDFELPEEEVEEEEEEDAEVDEEEEDDDLFDEIDEDDEIDHADDAQDDSKSLPSDTRNADSFDFVLEVDMEEAKEESSVTEESEPTALDRLPYFEKFMESMTEYGSVKRLNNFLHKKMADYFKKRKMDHVLIEVDHPEESLIKYGKKLDSFAALKEIDELQRREITAEMSTMKETKDLQCQEAADNFSTMLEREAEIGTGLISAKTGKEIPEKLIEKLISNQRNKAKELQQLRLTHIKIRNAVTEKNASIRALDKIGENYTLIEFEQLKIENQGHIDKIEERDDELTRLRKKCQGAIQCLAHVREKCSASEQNIRVMRETLIEKDAEKTEVREEMNRLKQERDYYRLETQRLKEENGLLTKDKLLIDMENAIKAIDELEELNRKKRDKLAIEKERLHNLKKHYDRELRRRTLVDKRKQDNVDIKKSSAIRCRGRRGGGAVGGSHRFVNDRASILLPKLDIRAGKYY